MQVIKGMRTWLEAPQPAPRFLAYALQKAKGHRCHPAWLLLLICRPENARFAANLSFLSTRGPKSPALLHLFETSLHPSTPRQLRRSVSALLRGVPIGRSTCSFAYGRDHGPQSCSKCRALGIIRRSRGASSSRPTYQILTLRKRVHYYPSDLLTTWCLSDLWSGWH